MPDSQRYVTCVCTANICRSPMAAKLLEHALAAEPEPLKSLIPISGGIAAWDGDGPSKNSVHVLKNVGLDISRHRSRRVTLEMAENSLILLCMTIAHKHILNESFPDLKQPVHLLRDFLPSATELEIRDPYGMDLNSYEVCRDSIVEAVPSVVEFLRKLVNSQP